MSNNFKDKSSTQEVSTNSYSPKTTPLIRWVWFILLLAGVGLFSESLFQKFMLPEIQVEMTSKGNQVNRDFHQLYLDGKIPNFFFRLKSINWTYYDKELKVQIPNDSLPFKTSPNGSYDLNIDAFSSSQENIKNAILQLNVIDLKSGNKIFELSRNYEIQIKK
jgi:hypothetical protein